MHRLTEWLQSDHLVQNCMMTENGKYPLVYIPGFYVKEGNTIIKEGGRNGRHVYKDYRRTSI